MMLNAIYQGAYRDFYLMVQMFSTDANFLFDDANAL